MQYFVFMIIILLLSINYHILYSIIQKCTTAGSIQVMLKPVVKWWASCAQAVALYSVPRVPKQYPDLLYRQCPDLLYRHAQGVAKQYLQCTRCAQACTHAVEE